MFIYISHGITLSVLDLLYVLIKKKNMRILNQKWYGPCNPSAPELTAFDTALATRVNDPEEVVWPANIEPINLSQRKWDDTQKMEFKRCHVETLRLICESTSWTGKRAIAEQSNAKEAFFSADL